MIDRCWVRFAPRTCPGRPWGQRAPVDHRCELVDVVPLAPHREHLCLCGVAGTDARDLVPAFADTRLPRSAHDDPTVVETWC